MRLGFAGLGMAGGSVVPEIAKLPYIQLTAAADLRPQSLDLFHEEYGGEIYQSVEEMCQSPNVDAVYVATPHEYHAEHTITALKSKKHVIVEKPMALSIDEAEAMNRAAEENQVKLLCGHTHSFDAPIRKMAQLVRSGEFGRLLMIDTSYYKNFMYRPWTSHDVAMSRGIILNQGPHQVDIVRLIGGGRVRSVRAMAGVGDRLRPAEGHYVCYLEFEDGVPTSLVFGGYARFNSGELVWGIGEGGQQIDPASILEERRAIKAITRGEDRDRLLEQRHEAYRYGAGVSLHGGARSGERTHQPFFGVTIVTCEGAEMRQSPDGLYVYDDDGQHEVSVAQALRGRQAEITELYEAVVNNRPVFHDGRWGEATLEVCLAILRSSAERREIMMSHQVPVVDVPM